MNYDCLIVGGGLAGLTCGIKCASEGLRTAILTGGMSSLHYSSGSIDLFGFDTNKSIIDKPYDYIKEYIKTNKEHPYAKVGLKTIKEAMIFFQSELEKVNLPLYNIKDTNHYHFTGLGTTKTTYFSQESVFNDNFKKAFLEKRKIAVLNFEGYRDFHPELTVSQLKNNPEFQGIEVFTEDIDLSKFIKTPKNLHEFRSIDIARIFETEKYLPGIAELIKKAAGDAKIVSLPAFISINNYKEIHQKLEKMTGLLIYEIPTLPPSILGLRMDKALKTRFAALGGELSLGDKVDNGEIENNQINYINTLNNGDTKHKANFYVLASGSFFSGGLTSSYNCMKEPIFDLKIKNDSNRNKWFSKKFFEKKGHPFMKYGVETNKKLNPNNINNKSVKNLFCVGSILSDYDPIIEGSGGGVAIATGYQAALNIIKGIKNKK